MPSYSSLLVIYAAWGIATGLAFWAAHIKLVSMLASKDQQGRFFGILDGGRGLVEAFLATVAIAVFAYVISQNSEATQFALQQVIHFREFTFHHYNKRMKKQFSEIYFI